MIALLSVLPPSSPRAIQARNAFSRRSRRAENCRNGSTLERDSVMTCLPAMPALGRGRARRLASTKSGRPAQIVLAVEHERVGLLVGEHVLAERRAERRQPLADLGEPLARLGIERGAGALEHQVIAFQHARLLGIEAERVAALPERVDAAEQRLVEQDAVPVPGLARRDLALDRQQRVVGVRAGEHAENTCRPAPSGAAGAFHRLDGVLERGRRRIAGDRGDLGVVLGEGAVEGRHEMLGRDAVEWRHAEGAGPVLEEGIGGGGEVGGWMVLICHARYMVVGPRSRTLTSLAAAAKWSVR